MANPIDFLIERNIKRIINNFVEVFNIYGISTRIVKFNPRSYRILARFESNRVKEECDSIYIFYDLGMICVDFQLALYWIRFRFLGLIYSKKWILNTFKDLQILTKDEMIIKDIIE